MESMHGSTRAEHLIQKVLVALAEFSLPFNKLSGIATNYAPRIVGSKRG